MLRNTRSRHRPTASIVAVFVLAASLTAACGSTTPTRPEAPERPERVLPDGMAEMREEMAANRGETRDAMDEMMSRDEEAPDPNNPWYGPVLDTLGLAAKIFTWF